MSTMTETYLGQFLKEKRQQIDPKSLDITISRRRTPGLRREEVAQRANISVTWYTWLEQGRGGTPSSAVLGRIAKALMLTQPETEYIFLTTLGRLPETDYEIVSSITPQMQQILDALNPNPALIRNLTWDVLAWNQAAAKVLTDYSQIAAAERNILRLFFLHKRAQSCSPEWQSTARLIVSAFRSDLARLGENDTVNALIAELTQSSEAFAQFWNTHEIHNFSEGVKHLQSAELGALTLTYSSFVVAGNPELSLVVYTPQAAQDREKIQQLLQP